LALTSSDRSSAEPSHAASDRNGSILAVCTTNVTFSPYLESRLRAELAGTDITVASAGTQAVGGSPLDPAVAGRIDAGGIDPSAFVARELTADLVKGADLILCASREERSMVVRLAPAALRRTYALADFSDLASQVVGTETPATSGSGTGQSFVRRVSETVERARSQVQARQGDASSIVEPYGQPQRVFDQMFDQVDGLLAPITAVLLGRPLSWRQTSARHRG